MTSGLRKRLVSTAKLLLAAALIALLFWKIDVRATLVSIAGISVGYVVLLLLISAVIIGVSCMKWQLFLSARGVTASLGSLFRLYLVGYFFNNFAPSNVGGDAARSLVLGQRIGSQSEAFGTVFLERFTGFIGMISVGLLMAACRPSLIANRAMGLFLLAMGLLLLAMLAFLLFPPLHRLCAAITGHPKAPRPLRKLGKFLDVVFFFRDKPYLLGLSLLYSFAFHFFTVVNTAVCCRALGIDADVRGLAVVVPMVLLVAAVPLTPNAIGVMEGAFVYFLSHVGFSPPEALAVSLLLRAKNLVVALAGGLVFLMLKLHPVAQQKTEASGGLRHELLRSAGSLVFALVSLGVLFWLGPHTPYRVKQWSAQLDGTTLHADLYLPRSRPDTLLLLLHGSNVRARTLRLYPALAALLAERGYVVCNLDQRGHGQSEGPSRVDSPDDLPFVADARRVMAALSRDEFAGDCDRRVMAGHSFGGGVAVASGMGSDLTDLVVSISPGRRLRERFIEGSADQIEYLRKRKSNDLGLEERIPASVVLDVLASYDIGQFEGKTLPKPLLIVEGSEEPAYDLDFTDALLESMLGDIEHVVISGANHYFGTGVTVHDGKKQWSVTGPETLEALAETIDQWLQKKR